jgi:hypothetical protein
MTDHAGQVAAELRAKLDTVGGHLTELRMAVAELEREGRAPPRAAVDQVVDLCLQFAAGSLKARNRLRGP